MMQCVRCKIRRHRRGPAAIPSPLGERARVRGGSPTTCECPPPEIVRPTLTPGPLPERERERRRVRQQEVLTALRGRGKGWNGHGAPTVPVPLPPTSTDRTRGRRRRLTAMPLADVMRRKSLDDLETEARET